MEEIIISTAEYHHSPLFTLSFLATHSDQAQRWRKEMGGSGTLFKMHGFYSTPLEVGGNIQSIPNFFTLGAVKRDAIEDKDLYS